MIVLRRQRRTLTAISMGVDVYAAGDALVPLLTAAILPVLHLVLSLLVPQASLPIYANPYTLRSHYDFIVVGGGSAGSVVSGRLSEEKGWSVLVVEAGGTPPPETRIPALYPVALIPGHPSHRPYFTTRQRDGLAGFVNRMARLVTGHGIGGSSLINGMFYVRGARQDYDHWASLGNLGWDYNTVLPFFLASQDYSGPKTGGIYGHGGPLGITGGFQGPLTRAFLQGGAQLGYPIIDVNGPSQIGFSYSSFTIKNGRRSSTGDCFLNPVPANLHILHSAKVLKVVLNKEKQAVGVEIEHSGMVFVIGALREVVVTAGALVSPQLLMLSGVGPHKHLTKHRIPVVADLPGVGCNLQDHVGVNGLTWTLPKAIPDVFSRYLVGLARYARDSTGPLATPDTELVNAWVRVDEGGDPSWPDIQLFMAGLSPSADKGAIYPSIWGLNRQRFKDYYSEVLGMRGLNIRPTLVQPKSRGTVTLKSSNPHHPPIINPKYLAHPHDVARLVRGIRVALALGNTTAFTHKLQARFFEKPLPSCTHTAYGSDAYWTCYVRHMATTTYHYVGTCRLGPVLDRLAVVDSELRVYGVKGLRVADASVMPTISIGNTNAPTIMIAERAAHLIRQAWQGQGR